MRGYDLDRGQSEVLGIVLLFALVMVVSGAVVVMGGAAINDAASDTSMESASVTMLELQSAASQSGHDRPQRISFAQTGDGGDVQAPDAGARVQESDAVSVAPDAGHFTVTVHDSSAGSDVDVVDEDLGTIVYAENDRTLAYQGGGVFRKAAGSAESVLVSPPEFGYDAASGEPTLSMGIKTIAPAGGDVDGDAFTVRQTGTTRHVPGSMLPLEGEDAVTITVESQYYRAWGEFFAARIGVTPNYDHAADAVTVKLSNPRGSTEAIAPIVSGGTTNVVDIRNQVTIDRYDSSSGGSPNLHGTAPIYVRSDVHVASGAQVGDVYTTKHAEIDGSADDVYHDGGYDEAAGATATDAGPVPPGAMPSINNYDPTIERKISDLEDHNDNAGVSDTIDAIETEDVEEDDCFWFLCDDDDSGNTYVLPEGDYYIEQIALGNDDKLVFEPDEGTIQVAVPDGIEAGPDAEIVVQGRGTVSIYSSGDIDVKEQTVVTNAGKDAPQFRVWQHSDYETTLAAESKFVGLIHAGRSGVIDIDSNNDGDIHGAIIGDFTPSITGAGRPFHYDEALADVHGPGATGGSSHDVRYLRISTVEVAIED